MGFVTGVRFFKTRLARSEVVCEFGRWGSESRAELYYLLTVILLEEL